MKMKFLMLLLLLLTCFAGRAALQHKLDKEAYYKVMSSGNLDEINNELEVVKATTINDKEGYEGALLMRKAGLMSRPKDKLANFKQGRIKLETALLNHDENTELHFLRLTIEEHAPKIVKYRSDIQKDKGIIVRSFKNLSPEVQHAILDYSKTSKVLTADELKSGRE